MEPSPEEAKQYTQSRNYPAFMDSEVLLLCSPEHDTGPCPKPHESNPPPQPCFCKMYVCIYFIVLRSVIAGKNVYVKQCITNV